MSAELDTSENRRYDWLVRSREIKERDAGVCQRCGKGDGPDYVCVVAHHIVPGRELPKPDARIDLNLVTVCCKCHYKVERMPARDQFEQIGKEEVVAILDMLAGGRCTPAYIADELDVTPEYVRGRLRDLDRLGLVEKVYRGLYELADSSHE